MDYGRFCYVFLEELKGFEMVFGWFQNVPYLHLYNLVDFFLFLSIFG